MLTINFYNSSSKKKEMFTPMRRKLVTFYSCGPTVYSYAHVGNLRSYIFADTIKRTLLANGYKVKHIMNITDVGHLVGDGDDGDDKIETAAKKEGKTAKDITEFYTNAFKQDIALLHILPPKKYVFATEHIKEQIKLIKKLEKKGLTYVISDGVYFNTEKYKKYENLLGVSSSTSNAVHARIHQNIEKKNPHDFALWKFSKTEAHRLQEWKSPWGIGFPGWHIECSAMSLAYLGHPIDIHSGGIDHLTVHHPNEIAQSEGAGYKPFVSFWMHNEYLVLNRDKMAKSKGNVIRISDIQAKGIEPLAFKYYMLSAHYRQVVTFSEEGLEHANHALINLKEHIAELPKASQKEEKYTGLLLKALNDDLNTPKALGILWDAIKSEVISEKQKRYIASYAESIFGLGLLDIKQISEEVKVLIQKRDDARSKKDFKTSDAIRNKLEKEGYIVKDTDRGTVVIRSQK